MKVEYPYGLGERIVLCAILLTMWGLLAVLTIGVVTQHTTPEPNFMTIMNIGNIVMLIGIIGATLGKPALYGAFGGFKKIKEWYHA